jgi:hypothetical protein
MKIKIIVFILLFAFTYLSCNKKGEDIDILDEKQYIGVLSNLIVNGQSFPRENMELSLTALVDYQNNCNPAQYGFIIQHNSTKLPSNEELVITNLPLGKTGKVLITSERANPCEPIIQANFALTIGKDLLTAFYRPQRNKDNFIMIENYDNTTKEIKGYFDITFLLEGKTADAGNVYSDTLRFRNESFKVRIK